MGPSVNAQIEIAASPETVREVFLDFPRYKDWCSAYTLSTLDENTKPVDLKAGEKIKVVIQGFGTFKPKILENTPGLFKWIGSLPFIFSGTHQFYFNPSEVTSGHTTLVNREDFSGALAFLNSTEKTQATFENFTRELKAEVERRGT